MRRAQSLGLERGRLQPTLDDGGDAVGLGLDRRQSARIRLMISRAASRASAIAITSAAPIVGPDLLAARLSGNRDERLGAGRLDPDIVADHLRVRQRVASQPAASGRRRPCRSTFCACRESPLANAG